MNAPNICPTKRATNEPGSAYAKKNIIQNPGETTAQGSTLIKITVVYKKATVANTKPIRVDIEYCLRKFMDKYYHERVFLKAQMHISLPPRHFFFLRACS